ncbi:glycosyltransferase family 31 protein [Phycomyces blakesleeanus]|uniref:Glycosyltransferase family 31 protein n=2 Tax=Phycomyces blakesleeanus TaxID=4837 RepID=A0A163AWN6_PHYB8|nr:glycosyltransferase family 31 protein [Phycomyces blakesleeanus NRRL 1555(-)]OAD76281.1 glycosyltransferase family 31 protein [Phycomyces blakesleeanus NRRL 1555(-)]|eukprot:XP_018294321.1 glycosyltransferase family 31 protein [Phycomyces blakesleeanus NRRL 1555(-)]
MPTPHGLPAYRHRSLSLTALNVPRRFHLPIILLRVLCVLPSSIGILRNLARAWIQPPFDDTGLFDNKSTTLIYSLAIVWCALAGYWSWILTTSMLRRWLYHYELSSAIIRLITLTFINWSCSAFISSHYGADEPIRKWMTICLILLVSNVLKLRFASNAKYHPKSNDTQQEPRITHRSTAVKVLILPFAFVVFITMFASLHQINTIRTHSADLVHYKLETPVATRHTELAESKVRVMVFVISAWTPKSLEKRQIFRETSLQLKPADDDQVSYFYRFILGEPPSEEVRLKMGPKIEAENAANKDMLILPCSDLYNDLSKKVYQTMVWSDQWNFDYLIKTDDDIFVRWDTITKEFITMGRQQRYWRGLSYWNMPPIRNNDNKNAELDYTLPIFPPYTAGALYILSRDVVHLIAGVGGPRMFVRNEDQNLGIWLFPYNIKPILDRRIQQIDVCEEDMIAKHFGDFGEPDAIGGTMHQMLDNLRNGRKMCTGFRSSVCGLCYPCYGKGNHWRDWNFDCDSVKGVTLLKQPQWSVVD